MSGSPETAERACTATPAAWYPDPDHTGQPGYHLRYWDGDAWTDWRFDDAAIRHEPTAPRSPDRPARGPMRVREESQDMDDAWWVAIAASGVMVLGVVVFLVSAYFEHYGEVHDDGASGFLGTMGVLLTAIVTPIAALVAIVAAVWGTVAHLRRARRRVR